MPPTPADDLARARAERDAARAERDESREFSRQRTEETRLLREYLRDVLVTLRFYAEGGSDDGVLARACSSRVFHPPKEGS